MKKPQKIIRRLWGTKDQPTDRNKTTTCYAKGITIDVNKLYYVAWFITNEKSVEFIYEKNFL